MSERCESHFFPPGQEDYERCDSTDTKYCPNCDSHMCAKDAALCRQEDKHCTWGGPMATRFWPK